MSSAVAPSTNTRLQTSLRAIHEHFLDALVDHDSSESLVKSTLEQLQTHISEGKAAYPLSDETLLLARTVVNDVAVIGQGLIDLENATSTFRSQLLRQAQSVLDANLARQKSRALPTSAFPTSPLHRCPKPSLQTPRHPTTTPITSALAPIVSNTSPNAASITESTRSASDPNSLPEFIEHAYKFFVTNIFNPYPTRAEKEAIVRQTNNERVTFSSISNWFTNARRRCGWTTILKERCDGNREQLVALATRVFVNLDPQDPVDPAVVRELMEMKEAVETMYERNTRTSAWIEDLEDLEDLIRPFSGASTGRPQVTEEDRRREQEAQKKKCEFEQQKRKMQAEALRKAEKVTKMMQLEQSKPIPQQHAVSLAEPFPPQQQPPDEDPSVGPVTVTGGKRKLVDEGDDVYRFPDLRQISPVSRSSSFTSDLSSEGRVPSLTWSDSGDERPYKRSRSSLDSPPSSYTSSPRLSPAFEIPGSFDYSFNFAPQDDSTGDLAAFNTLFDFSVAPCETLMMRGKKRSHDDEEHNDVASHAKRRRSSQPVVASVGPDLLPSSSPSTPPAPSTPLFTPRPSIDATPTQQPRKRSIQLPDLETVLQLDLTQPPPVQIAPPDASLPLDVGVFNWSSDAFVDAGAGDAHADFSHLLQLFGTDGLQVGEAPVEMLPFDLNPAAFQPNGEQNIEHQSALPDDLSGLMSGLMSDQALQEMGMSLSSSLTATPNLSRESSLDPTAYNDVLLSATPADLAEKALRRERKRKELENRRAEIERESARLAELERELEDE